VTREIQSNAIEHARKPALEAPLAGA